MVITSELQEIASAMYSSGKTEKEVIILLLPLIFANSPNLRPDFQILLLNYLRGTSIKLHDHWLKSLNPCTKCPHNKK